MKIKLYLTFKDQRDWIKFTGYNAGFKSHIYIDFLIHRGKNTFRGMILDKEM